jgi:hypothetical protein
MYVPPIGEQRSSRPCANVGELAREEAYSAATPDIIDAILASAGQLASEQWAPLNRVGDSKRCAMHLTELAARRAKLSLSSGIQMCGGCCLE